MRSVVNWLHGPFLRGRDAMQACTWVWTWLWLVLALALAKPLCAAPTTASLWGTVRFQGRPPEPRLIEMKGDRYCVERQSQAQWRAQELLVGKEGGIANAIVYVKEGPIARATKPSAPVDLAMRDCMFTPRVIALQCGQLLRIRNDDRTLHTVYARPKANAKFIHPLFGPQDPPFEVSFKAPELPIALRCDVQPWMIAYVAVFDHPYFCVTGPEGTFELPDLPEGDYAIEVWHEKLGTQLERIGLRGGEKRSIQFMYSLTK